MKRFLAIFLTILISSLCLFSLPGCESGTNDDETQKAVVYALENTADFVCDNYGGVSDYNKRCENPEDEIEIVYFDSADALKSKLSTELMSGGGPDLISYSLLYILGISYEKLIEQGCFADLNEVIAADASEDKLDLNDYNQKALEAGVVDGKRYAIPHYFKPNFYITSKQQLSNYIDLTTKSLSYNDVISINEKLKEENSEKLICSGASEFINDYIYDNIDFFGKTYSFDGDFGATAEKLKSIGGSTEYGADALFSDNNSTPYELCVDMAEIEQKGETPLIVGAPSTKPDEYSAELLGAVFINQNSQHKQQALDFIKYALSEEVQNKTVGAQIEKYDYMYEIYSGIYYPVNNNSYDALMKNCSKIKYLDESVSLSDNSIKMLEQSLSEISNYKFAPSTNYMDEIGNELISDFIDNKITTDKFVNDLSSKTQLYLTE